MHHSNNENQTNHSTPHPIEDECQRSLQRSSSITTKSIYITTALIILNAIFSIVYLTE